MYAREWEGGRWLLSNRQRVKMGLRFAELDPRGLNSSPAFMFCHWRKSASFFLSLFVSLRGKIGHFASFERSISKDSIKLFFLVERKFRITSILVSCTSYSVQPQFHTQWTNWSGTFEQMQVSKLSCIFISCTVLHITSPILLMSSCSKALI